MGYSARTLVAAASVPTALLDAAGRVLVANPEWNDEARQGGIFAPEGSEFPRPVSHFPGRAELVAALDPAGPEDRPEAVLTGLGPRGDQRVRILRVECDCGTRQWLVSIDRQPPAVGTGDGERSSAGTIDRAKADFLALLGHEIRTPVTGVVGTVDLLRALPLAEDVRGLVDSVHRSTHALKSMIDDLLDLARLETDQFDLNVQPVSLRGLLEDVSTPLQQLARHKGILLLVGVAPHVPAVVETDPARLRQVLTNLLSNAVKFTERGEIVVTAEAEGDGLLIVVSDTGRGMDDADRRRVFAPFVQVDSSARRRHEGAGLGLAIAARVVACMGGTIDVASEIDRGSEFRLRLPLVPAGTAESTAPAPDGQAEADLSSRLTGQRVAVAAPSRRSTDVLIWTLTTAGAEAFPTTFADVIAHTPDADTVIWCDDSHDPTATARAEAVMKALGRDQRAIMISTTDPRTGLVPRRGGPALVSAPFTLRRLVAAVTSERTGVRGAPVSVPQLPGGRVLLAEDNEVNRGVFKRMVELLGVECDTVGDGEAAARAVLADRGYDVVLMDVQMPRVDGLEATRRIRMSDTRTPILALTATALRGDRERCLEAGMNAHVEKPITLPELRRALAPYLRPREAGAAPGGPEASVDLSRLHEMEEELADRSLVVATVSTFLAELGNRQAAMSDALGRDDRGALRAVAHTLKSSSALLGAKALARSCLRVEQQAATGAHDELATLVADVQRAAIGAAEAMARYVTQASRPV